jgi:hypothetical protein
MKNFFSYAKKQFQVDKKLIMGRLHELFWQLYANRKIHILVADYYLLHFVHGTHFIAAS